MSDVKKRIFNSTPVQLLLSASAKALATSRSNRGIESGDPSALSRFRERLKQLKNGRVLELGTRRVEGRPSTIRRDWAPQNVSYVGCDYQPGLDVDIVIDAERLSSSFELGSVDAVIACSVFEHIRKPWLAAREIAKVLKPGGIVFVQTHQTYPIHADPYDYWRFSREAMETLLDAETGFSNQTSWYDFPAVILSDSVPALTVRPAFLNVNIVAERA
jgi:SAM-dependent methyltransferase